MFSKLPKSVENSLGWKWDEFFPFYEDLLIRKLTEENLHQWMCDWNSIQCFFEEIKSTLYISYTQDTRNDFNSKNYKEFSSLVEINVSQMNQQLKEKLIESELEPENFKIPLRNMKNEVSFFKKENKHVNLSISNILKEYNQILNSRTIKTESGKKSFRDVSNNELQDQDRNIRKDVWVKKQERRMQERESINQLWIKQLELRTKLAKEAGFPSFPDYQLSFLNNTDFSLADVKIINETFMGHISPGAQRTYIRRQKKLGLEKLKPWDLFINIRGTKNLKPINSVENFPSKISSILSKLDPQFQKNYQSMIDNNRLDILHKKSKFQVAFHQEFPFTGIPFLSQNTNNNDLELIAHIHEVGHSMHVFEKGNLPFWQQRKTNMGIEESIAFSFNFLFFDFLEKDNGGFYSKKEAIISKIQFLENFLLYSRLVLFTGSFQIWAFENPDISNDPSNCDLKWAELLDKYMPEVDYSGFEEEKSIRWQSHRINFIKPFFFNEYILGMFAALQVWENYIDDPKNAIEKLRYGMSLGETKAHPQLYSAIGSRLSVANRNIFKSVAFIMKTILDLESELKNIN